MRFGLPGAHDINDKPYQVRVQKAERKHGMTAESLPKAAHCPSRMCPHQSLPSGRSFPPESDIPLSTANHEFREFAPLLCSTRAAEIIAMDINVPSRLRITHTPSADEMNRLDPELTHELSLLPMSLPSSKTPDPGVHKTAADQ
jgi:hypothetical protein